MAAFYICKWQDSALSGPKASLAKFTKLTWSCALDQQFTLHRAVQTLTFLDLARKMLSFPPSPTFNCILHVLQAAEVTNASQWSWYRGLESHQPDFPCKLLQYVSARKISAIWGGQLPRWCWYACFPTQEESKPSSCPRWMWVFRQIKRLHTKIVPRGMASWFLLAYYIN